MKLLTLNFLTCAVKRCKDSAVAPSDPATSTTATTTETSPDDPSNPSTDPTTTDPAADRPLSATAQGSNISLTGRAFPLQIHSAELTRTETSFNPQFLRNILPRCEWWALREVAASVGFNLPVRIPVSLGGDGDGDGDGGDDASLVGRTHGVGESEGEGMDVDVDEPAGVTGKASHGESGPDAASGGGESGATSEEQEDQLLQKLHEILIQTEIESGKLVCGNCGHEYKVMEGIPNFLLPPHLL
ncbi:MAG: hypothetical protein M1831_003889 [Alyxoria varia]|nr:MAG: hypothetical protein M1831_003889 [Alyxoria varia]